MLGNANQYEQEQTKFIIYGHYIPRPNEKPSDTLERAKQEALHWAKRRVELLESFTNQDWEKSNHASQT